eukprot:Ihof_evm1s84 gene=Ihof_evmTU1s84
MQRCMTIAAVRQIRRSLGGRIGFVPTMGYLHEGHLSLVRQAKKECDHVFASLFVNPAQFAPGEDLDSYPRTVERDLNMLQKEGVHTTFLPTVKEMYGGRNVMNQEGTMVSVNGLSHQLEGSFRPTFFTGVATVVAKLLNIVQPDLLYLGQKDGQQCIVIKNMIQDLNIPTELKIGDIVREKDGLAMSSRNVYLNEIERAAAPNLQRGMRAARDLYEQGVRDTVILCAAVKDTIAKANSPVLELQYVSINDVTTLQEASTIVPGARVMLS